MDDAIQAFMTFLELERHASHETVRNYASDLRQFQTFMTTEYPDVRALDPATVQPASIRASLHWLDRTREKSSSMARKLASLRSFYRYLQREGMVGLNPAEAIRTPKQPMTYSGEFSSTIATRSPRANPAFRRIPANTSDFRRRSS
mgnify:CR=1 FL=1